MSKLQKLSFKSVNEFLDYIPKEELAIVEALRSTIFDCIPEVREKLNYNVPFYFRHYRMCFIWPASIPYGGIKNGVSLGLTHGEHFENYNNYLEKGSRKLVYSRVYYSIRDIDFELLRDVLFQLIEIDNNLKIKKK